MSEKNLESMVGFFDKRSDDYENHMLNNVDGAECFYKEVAKLIPVRRHLQILDLGCGTGLEIDEILKVNNNIRITGLDLSENMLAILKDKYKEQPEILNLIQSDYLKYEFEDCFYDVAISVMSLHHFSHQEKIKLYEKIHKSLRTFGFYIEADYMAPNQEYEDLHFAENERKRVNQNIKDGYYHYDTPCTVENQIGMLLKAGFSHVEKIWNAGNTTILKAIV